ncbi:uncharacterized protein LOC107462228 isoform X1 [Arachis duranensis]|uniref:Uncharacterized protein LOC107462228 isoform X1 n=1 Tax=Arachis duranensis TaxID=130453 RepID=A0A9C6WNQ1_ARADU|nr:uncharacterized protein LOC107462228 isoform X1 [Arachis duranensis]
MAAHSSWCCGHCPRHPSPLPYCALLNHPFPFHCDLTRTWPPCGSFSSSQSMLLLDAFNKDRASLPQPLPNPPPLAPIPVAAPDPRTQEMINEKLKKAEDLGEQGKVDEAQKALEEAEALKKCQLPTRQEPVVDNSNSSKYTAADMRIAYQKLCVCDICGVLLSVYDRNVC